MPETRNEKVDGDSATMDVKDPNDKEWVPMKFVRESGSWKIALADDEYEKEFKEMTEQLKKKEQEKNSGEDKDKESEAESGGKPVSDS